MGGYALIRGNTDFRAMPLKARFVAFVAGITFQINLHFFAPLLNLPKNHFQSSKYIGSEKNIISAYLFALAAIVFYVY